MPAAGLDMTRLAALLRNARRRILLYAPPYSRFATAAPLCEALKAALEQPGGASLTALCLPDLHEQGWMEEFMATLRPRLGRQAIRHELEMSRAFLRGLAARFGERVTVLELTTRPCLPVLVADDHILFGQFCHSPVLTPEGFWHMVQAPVERLFGHAEQETEPEGPAETRASFRIISECAHALRRARTRG